MPRTQLFKSGRGQAVLIPAELAYADVNVELEIIRHGDVITIFPARKRLKHAVAALQGIPKPARVEQREPIEVPERGE
jgi:antitoxin VapB